MSRGRLLIIRSLVIALSGPALSAAPTTQPDVSALITALADRDPRARASASKELTDLGPAAREALTVAATDDADPEIRSRAATILAALPLTRPGDPVPVRRRLEQYRKADAAARQQLIEGEWAAQEGDESVAIVLLRVLSDATNEDDRWLAGRVLGARHDAATRRLVRKATPRENANLPLLLTTAGAWSGRNHERANELYARAVKLAAETVAPAREEITAAFDMLAEQAYLGRRYDELVVLLRRRAAIEQPAEPTASSSPASLDRLLAIHAAYGPFDGFTDDLQTLGRAGRLTTPAATYAYANLVRRAGRPVSAEAIAFSALAMNDSADALARFNPFPHGEPGEADWNALLADRPPGERHVATGQLLLYLRQDRWAAREFQAVVRQRAGETGDPFLAAAHQRLAIIAVDAARYADAAGHVDAAIEQFAATGAFFKVDRNGRQFQTSEEMLRADAALQRLRAARVAGDAAEVIKQVDVMVDLPMADGDTVNELIPVLRHLNRNGDAQNLFDRYYSYYKMFLDQDPDHPEYLNNLAWLCGRSGERAEEGVELAEKALKTDPNNAAYLDTAAEAYFRNGDAKKAADLERKALERRGADVFMQGQLRRFEKGIAK